MSKRAKIKVSVVVPVFNQEKYLKKTIPCILNQTYQNLEIVLVNDGSTDQSASIIEHFACVDSRIVIVTQKNGGLVSAVTAGVKKATGDYLCFIDPDDYVGKTYVEAFVAELDDDYDFVAMGFYRKSGNSCTPYCLRDDRILSQNDIKMLQEKCILSNEGPKFSDEVFVARWNKLYRIDCVKQIMNMYSHFKCVSLGEDSVFTYILLHVAKNGKTVKKPGRYYYTVDNTNSMISRESYREYYRKAQTTGFCLNKIENYYSDKDRHDLYLFYLLIKTFYLKLLEIQRPRKEMRHFQSILRKSRLFKNSCRAVLKIETGWYKVITKAMVFWMLYFQIDPRRIRK